MVAGRPTPPSTFNGPQIDPVSIETRSLAEAIEGEEYGQQLQATGGSGGYGWTLAAGSLPAGLKLSPTGLISGTPVAPVTSSFRVRATDSGGRSATADLSIPVVQTLAVHTWTLPDAEVGTDYAAELQAVGGRGTRVWSLTGEAAAWLAVSPAGALSGVPSAAGVASVTVAVADESGQQATRQLPIVVRDPLAVAAITLPTATQGRAYAAQLVATGGDGAYAWALEGGALPAGLALTAGGALAGTPTSGGDFAFTVRVADGAGRVATRALSLTVERAPTIQTGGLPPADVGEPYTAQLVATGGTGGYTWSLTDGALPAGMALSSAGAISGTPTATGSSTFTVRVTDEAGPPVTAVVLSTTGDVAFPHAPVRPPGDPLPDPPVGDGGCGGPRAGGGGVERRRPGDLAAAHLPPNEVGRRIQETPAQSVWITMAPRDAPGRMAGEVFEGVPHGVTAGDEPDRICQSRLAGGGSKPTPRCIGGTCRRPAANV